MWKKPGSAAKTALQVPIQRRHHAPARVDYSDFQG
jgi:hypothetical protein